MSQQYGYVRVSTKEQNEARQMIAMEEFGIPRQQIYLDKQSGKNFDRPQYQRLMKRLRSGDTIVIKSIDRLGRNYDEILHQWQILSKERWRKSGEAVRSERRRHVNCWASARRVSINAFSEVQGGGRTDRF